MINFGSASKFFLFVLICSVSVFSIGFDAAAQKRSTSKKKKDKKAAISFDDELIQGEVKRPELFYLLQKRKFNYKRLIKLRENFIPEMTRSAEDVSIFGSQN